ncbi:MAG: Gfo/Idh/MocA family oxidoreductase [Thermotogae bacterium]|nr:Gfo/Idh/MocA family oxidoreductase [Thermotogota bacterium]RKX55144.1 MAG: gfo/Idh/MocA family oxidoreductase [Thermotoga sp.]HDM70546.1 Gfo/Idh/MocA family oxidoreductase [Thermotogales bacterium]
MSNKLKWGIAGCGNVAHVHALAIQEIGDVELIACYDVKEDKAKEFGEKYGINWFKELSEFLEQPLDIISICTPSGSRKQIAIEAMEKGINVITEKPMEVTLEAIDEMIETSKKYGVTLGCILQTRFAPSEQKMRELVDKGELGKIILLEADVRWFRSKEYYKSGGWRGTWKYDGGGALMNQAIHTIDLMMWYGGSVKRIYGFTRTLFHEIEVEDSAVATLEFENGALGVVKATTSITPGFPRKLGIYGTKMSVELIGEDLYMYDFENREGKLLVTGETVATSSNPAGFSHENHKKQFMDFVDAVKHKRKPMVDGEEARKVVKLILSIYESSKTGKPVELKGV